MNLIFTFFYVSEQSCDFHWTICVVKGAPTWVKK